jgi:hypothetical protein
MDMHGRGFDRMEAVDANLRLPRAQRLRYPKNSNTF